ncbi:ethanolamine ammonia-lyase subunit EutC [Thalassolituus maritimus]|uniref:Ethanolamine ammonia-lyase small subunit n=1 Tax=Thalassolituus maritimus TaxID=484498 RepID=A0ABQ0A0I8_9GAMM
MKNNSTGFVDNPVVENPWRRLREFTDARIGLGRAGVSLPTKELLEFQLSHARARDAVHFPLDANALTQALKDSERIPTDGVYQVNSRAENRTVYLQRPDLGRRLSESCREKLQHDLGSDQNVSREYDLGVVVVDGLSSLAVQQNVVPFLETLLPQLPSFSLAPITLVQQGRVAIGDEVGELLNARCVIVLIGERPGLSSPDSLGLYLTYQPHVGLTDAARNCISNIRPAGLSYIEAARRAKYLLEESRHLKLSGVNLKDRTQDDVVETVSANKNFLIS